jgi:hypothetical protein
MGELALEETHVLAKGGVLAFMKAMFPILA